ncbi:hypothetical protein [Kitasatospora sp. NPDC056184]|uniref:hypothetical protein n=1 Tax=Kitasatospora sp. NPDC056184 TaxID=3345738 RepID=UPI0035DDD663
MRDHAAETGAERYDPDHDTALQHALRRERHRRDIAECAREAAHQARQTTDAAHRRLAGPAPLPSLSTPPSTAPASTRSLTTTTRPCATSPATSTPPRCARS